MGRLTAFVLRSFRAWDRPSRTAVLIAMTLLLISFFTLAFGPAEIRQPALIGFIGLLIVTQVVFIWANRHMVTPYTQAQRYYLAENFDAARRLLEQQAADQVDVKTLTLLGNTYRQLGLLDKSEEVLTKAVELRPFDHFPLYGFGRTLLVEGQYDRAVSIFRQAAEVGAPPVVWLDLGEAYYRQGLPDEAGRALEMALSAEAEPGRTLMARYLRYRLGAGGQPSPDEIKAGLPYWQSHADRFRHTPYGHTLAEDVQVMRTLMEES